MSTTDYRTLHIYRIPVYQKRVPGIDTHPSNSHVRSPSPKRSVLASRRRHSTPPASSKNSADRSLSPSSTFLKYYHSHSRAASMRKEIYSPVDSVRTPPRPISLVKLRHQDDRAIRVVTTPTSVKSFTDVLLPVAKKNRNNIVESPSSPSAEFQTMIRPIPRAKREQIISLNLEHELSMSNANSHDQSLQDNTSKIKSIRGCHTKCPCGSFRCSLCHWYCRLPFYCWMACVLFVLAVSIGVFMLIRLLFN